MLEYALKYLQKGASVMPVGKNKIPLIVWKEFQTRKPTEEEVRKWWTDFPEANIGVITGKISNLIVVDVEKGGDISRFPETDLVQTGGGGWHLYYSYTPFENKTRIFPLTDIRGDGGYVVAPPSIHQSGGIYKILKQVGRKPFPRALFGQKVEAKSEWKNKIVSPILVGSRNSDFTSIVGGLLNKFPQEEWEPIVWKMVQDHNTLQEKPLTEFELRTTFDSIAKRESQKRNSGGDIKDVVAEITDDVMDVRITLSNCVVCFRVKNLIGNLLEATVLTWISKTSGLSHEIPFYLKINSDSNKDQWARLLSKTFDKKEEKEVYPWTIIIAKVSAEIESQIRKHKQDFIPSEIIAKPTTWLKEPFIQEDQINTFFGLGSSGKTLLSIYFSIELYKNGINTLFIDYENDGSNWKDKIEKMNKNENTELVYYDSEQIPLAEQVDKLKEVIKRRNIKLVIIDSASLSTGESTSDEKSVIRLMSGIKLLKTTTLLIAHQRKNDGEKTPIGSIQFENQARNVWNFTSTQDDFENHILHIACKHTKANNTWLRKDPIGFQIAFNENDIIITNEDASVNFKKKYTINQQTQMALKENPKGLSYKELADILGITSKNVSFRLNEGKSKGLYKNEGGLWTLSDGQKFDF